MKKLFVSVVVLIQWSSLSAQSVDCEIYMHAAGENAMLYRQVFPIAQIRKKSNDRTFPYLSSPMYEKGSLVYRDKLYSNVLLNLDALSDELLLYDTLSYRYLQVNKNFVASFTLSERQFINIDNAYYEVLYDGQLEYYKKWKKVYTEKTIRESIVRSFETLATLYALRYGKLHKITNLRSLKKIFNAPKEKEAQPVTEAIQHIPDRTDELFLLADLQNKLPNDYFEPVLTTADTSYLSALLASRSTVTSENKVYRIGDVNVAAKSDRIVLTGYVRNVATGEAVIEAALSIEGHATQVLTDLYGFYRIIIPKGSKTLNIRSLGMEDMHLQLEVYANGALDINLKEKVTSLRSVTISAESNHIQKSTQIGLEKLPIIRIKKIPAVFGEADVVKVLLTLPGVKSVGESSGGFNVRGGAIDQNLILFNEGTVYNPSHLFGLFSAFNPDVVNDIELYKSTLPAKYGGRISSVLEVNSRTGNTNKITGTIGLGLLASKIHLEGPLIKDKTTFILGARTTYSDWILSLLPEDSGYKNGTAHFHDVTAGLTHKFNSANTLYLNGYYSADGYSFSADNDYYYRNLNLALKWRSILNERHFMTLSSGYDKYYNRRAEKGNPVNAYELEFNIEQYYLKACFDWLINEQHNLSYGFNGFYYNLLPGNIRSIGDLSQVQSTALQRERGLEMALYASDKWSITDKLLLDLGLRFSFYSAIGPYTYNTYRGDDRNESTISGTVNVPTSGFVKPYFYPELRTSIRYTVIDDFILKAAFNTMRQHLHLLSNTAVASPIDTWKLSDANIAPQTGWQTAIGVYKNFFDNHLECSVEGYYKRMQAYLDYKSGAILSMNPTIEQDVLETDGKAYGVEIMFKKPMGKLNGWVAYSYSRTMLKEAGDKQAYEINRGNWYPTHYDKPHDVKLILNYKFTQRYSFSINLDYATGRPVTVPVSKYYIAGGYRLEYSDRNAYRIPDYFRADIAFNIEPSHNLKLWTHSVITFGVYNVTGRKNAFSVYYDTSGGTKIQSYQLSIFGAPIPYINYTLKF